MKSSLGGLLSHIECKAFSGTLHVDPMSKRGSTLLVDETTLEDMFGSAMPG